MENTTVEVDPHPDFVDGYNQGYFLAKEMPQFASDMAKYMPKNERGSGFTNGIEQYGRDFTKEKQRNLEKDFKDNKGDAGIDKNSRENLLKSYPENKNDMGISSKDRLNDWLMDKDENKRDMDINREPEKDHDDREPDFD